MPPGYNPLRERDSLLAYIKALPAETAAQVWMADALGTEDFYPREPAICSIPSCPAS